HIPAGMTHALKVPDGDSARGLNITTPGHERFMRAAGTPGRSDEPATPQDQARLMQAADTYATETLRPPPEPDLPHADRDGPRSPGAVVRQPPNRSASSPYRRPWS